MGFTLENVSNSSGSGNMQTGSPVNRADSAVKNSGTRQYAAGIINDAKENILQFIQYLREYNCDVIDDIKKNAPVIIEDFKNIVKGIETKPIKGLPASVQQILNDHREIENNKVAYFVISDYEAHGGHVTVFSPEELSFLMDSLCAINAMSPREDGKMSRRDIADGFNKLQSDGKINEIIKDGENGNKVGYKTLIKLQDYLRTNKKL